MVSRPIPELPRATIVGEARKKRTLSSAPPEDDEVLSLASRPHASAEQQETGLVGRWWLVARFEEDSREERIGADWERTGYAPDQTQQSSPQHQNYTQSSGAPSPYMQSYPGVLRSSPGADYPSRHGSIASSSASGGYVPVSSDGASMAGANAQTSPYPPIHPNMPAPYGGNYSR